MAIPKKMEAKKRFGPPVSYTQLALLTSCLTKLRLPMSNQVRFQLTSELLATPSAVKATLS